jgi:hypothetical protein
MRAPLRPHVRVSSKGSKKLRRLFDKISEACIMEAKPEPVSSEMENPDVVVVVVSQISEKTKVEVIKEVVVSEIRGKAKVEEEVDSEMTGLEEEDNLADADYPEEAEDFLYLDDLSFDVLENPTDLDVLQA